MRMVVLQCPVCGTGLMPGAVDCPTCRGRQAAASAAKRAEVRDHLVAHEEALEENEKVILALAARLARDRPELFEPRHHNWRRDKLFGRTELVRCDMPPAIPVGPCSWKMHGPAELRGVMRGFPTGVTAKGTVVRFAENMPTDVYRAKKCGGDHSVEYTATLGDGKPGPRADESGLFQPSPSTMQPRSAQIARIADALRRLAG